MARRFLPAALGLVLLAAVLLVLLSGPEQPSVPAEDLRPLPGLSLPSGGPEAGLALPVGDPAPGSRISLSAILPASAVSRDSLPSFAGRLLLPDGSPAAGARIEAHGMPGWAMAVDIEDPRATPVVSWETETGEDGRFLLPELDREGLRFLIRIESPPRPTLELVNLPATLGRTRDLGDLRLHAGFSIAGRVTDGAGRPVAGAQIRPIPEPESAATSQWLRDRLQPLPGYRVLSGADGSFRLSALPPGRVRLLAEAAGFAPDQSVSAVGAEEAEVSGLTVVLSPSLPVRGRVLDLSGRPVADARLRLETGAGDRVDGRSGADGGFRLDAPLDADQIHLRVAAHGYRPLQRTLHGAERTQALDLLLEPLAPLRGRVLSADGRPLPGATVALLEAGRARIQAAESPERIPALETIAAGPDGGFEFTVDLRQTWDRDFVVAAWSEEHAAARSQVVSLRPDAPAPADLELRLQRGLVIYGRVLGPDHQPLSSSRLTLRLLYSARERPGRTVRVPETRRRGTLFRTASSDQEGGFRFGGLPVGDYRVEALYPGLSPGESAEIALLDQPVEALVELHRPSAIQGRIIGQLDSFASLRATAVTAGTDPLDTLVEADGSFVFPELLPDTYEVIVREVDPAFSDLIFHHGAGEGLARADGVIVVAGQTTRITLEIDVSGLAFLSGSVTVNGEPTNRMSLFLVPRGSGLESDDPRLAQRAVMARLRSTTTNQLGEFRLAAVEPGDYWLVAERAGTMPRGIFRYDSGTGGGPLGLARARLSLGGGETHREDFDLKMGRLEGRAMRLEEGVLVPAGDGSGFVGAQDSALGIGTRPFLIMRNGNFEADWVPAGNYFVTIRSRRFEIVDEPVAIQPGGVTRIEPVLQPRADTSPRPIQ